MAPALEGGGIFTPALESDKALSEQEQYSFQTSELPILRIETPPHIVLQGIAINPFGPGLTITKPPRLEILLAPEMMDMAVNPFNPALELTLTEASDDAFFYNNFYISRVVIIPAMITIVLTSILLMYIILRHLRPVMKLYISVIFYAFSVLFFAGQLFGMMIFDVMNPGRVPDCEGLYEKVWTSLQITSILMPSIAVLVVTLIRVIFLKFPFHWRDILCFKNQGFAIIVATAFTFLLGSMPLLNICEMEMFSSQCVLVKDRSVKCVSCFILTLGLGLVLPQLLVVGFYFVIYTVVKDARASNKKLSSTTRNATQSSIVSGTGTLDEKSGKEESTSNKTERETFPWSIIVILMLNICSAIPWVVMIGAPELLYRNRQSEIYLTLDLMYAVLLISTSVSPLGYLITTRVVRDKTIQCLKNMCCCCR